MRERENLVPQYFVELRFVMAMDAALERGDTLPEFTYHRVRILAIDGQAKRSEAKPNSVMR